MRRLLALGLILLCVPVTALTFFSYSDGAVEELEGLDSCLCMSRAQLQKWDRIAVQAIEAEGLPYFVYERIFTYLYVAQADAARLAGTTKGAFSGSLDPVSARVLSIFLPNHCRPKIYCTDSFSEKIADLVVAKVEARVKREKKRSPAWKCPKEYKETYTEGLNIAKWETWVISDPKDYWPAPPPAEDSPVWTEQVCEIKRIQYPMTPAKRRAITYWAGMCGFGSGDWRTIANTYLFSHDVSLRQTLRVRSILNVSLYDALIACLGAKYHYMVDRPQMRDPSVCYIIPAPGHPSYPAGHSVEAGDAETILSDLIPCEACRWQKLAHESGISRIWAGIHYPIDDTAGDEAGKRIAEAVLAETK